jgi:hypothetical protein
VFPRSGDLPGAWAPGTRQSKVEWLEVDFEESQPVRAVRVFETCAAGSTFAVTVASEGGHELVYEGRPVSQAGAAMLEVAIEPPRAVRSVRVYIDNTLNKTWSEIDTIGLVTAEPLPLERRTRVPRFRPSGCSVFAFLAVLLCFAVGGFMAWQHGSHPEPPPIPMDAIDGANMMVWHATVDELADRDVVWAIESMEVSTQYGGRDWAGYQAVGRPDVLPEHGDVKRAWAPKAEDYGPEWIVLRFEPTRSSAVAIVETYHPGAVVRVEDLTDGVETTLWSGATSPSDESRVLSLELPSPRTIDRLRVRLDTRRVEGWNQIDAVGLVPVTP